MQHGNVEPVDGMWAYTATVCPLCRKIIVEIGQLVVAGSAWHFLFRTRAFPRNASRVSLGAEVPTAFAADYLEACEVLDASPKAAAALGRRCLQHLLREHVRVKAKDLADQIQEVLDAKTLPSDLAEDIDAIRHIGNFAAHPTKSLHSGEILDVEPGEAEWTLTVLEGLLDFYFVRTAERAAKRNELNAKLAQAKKNTAIKKPP